MTTTPPTTREYNEARAKWAALDKERVKLEAKEDIEDDERLVEIQDQQHALMTLMNTYRANRKAAA